jgi:hypothetical protein
MSGPASRSNSESNGSSDHRSRLTSRERRDPRATSDNFLHSFKGAPSARRAWRPGRGPREAAAANRGGDERPEWPAVDGPGNRPPAVPAVSARRRTRPRGPGRWPRGAAPVAGKIAAAGTECRALSGSAPPASMVLCIPQPGRACGAPLTMEPLPPQRA